MSTQNPLEDVAALIGLVSGGMHKINQATVGDGKFIKNAQNPREILQRASKELSTASVGEIAQVPINQVNTPVPNVVQPNIESKPQITQIIPDMSKRAVQPVHTPSNQFEFEFDDSDKTRLKYIEKKVDMIYDKLDRIEKLLNENVKKKSRPSPNP